MLWPTTEAQTPSFVGLFRPNDFKSYDFQDNSNPPPNMNIHPNMLDTPAKDISANSYIINALYDLKISILL